MGSDANRLRKKWQDYSAKNATIAELSIYDTFKIFFNEIDKTGFEIREKPGEFSKIYVDIKLSNKDIKEIYKPKELIQKHGVFPDFAIDNKETGKTIYLEVKRQDGWVENKKRSDGRGNAHERLCKYFTPGLLQILRKQSKIEEPNLPFWIIFQGDITRDPCRVREITCWFKEYTPNYFFWRDINEKSPLIEHFLRNIKPLLT